MRAAFVAILLLLGGTAGTQPGSQDPMDAAADEAPTVEEQVAVGARLISEGRFDEAIDLLTTVLARRPGFGPALANRALAYAWTNRLEEATRDLDAAARTMPASSLIHRVRAITAQRRSDDVTALAEFSRSLELEPGHPLTLRFRANMYQRAGNHAAALADADTYIAAHPEDPNAYVLKADLLIGQGERLRAEAEAARLITRFPGDAYTLASAARIYDALADRDRALAAINEAVSRSPNIFHYRLQRAKFRRWNDFGGRRADLMTALELDPGDGDVITELGLLDVKERRWRDAIARFSAVLELEPRDYGLMAYRALARLNAGQRQLAERDFRTALAAASGADDFGLVCNVFAREGFALNWGMEACNRAIRLNPNDSYNRASRGLLALRLGRLGPALADYSAAITADRRRAAGHYGRALVLHRLGRRQAALADRAQALVIDPGIAETFEEYGLPAF